MAGHRDLPVPLLRTFAAIADCGGFSAAAERLRITQPTVSQQLMRLEQLTGGSLIDRARRPVALTARGRTLLDYARRILLINDEAVSTLTAPGLSGTLRVGIPHEFTLSILPALAGAFSQSHPDLVIQVDCELSKTLLADADRYDLVIALHDSAESTGGIRLQHSPLAWVAGPDFQWPRGRPLGIVAAPAPCIYRAAMETALRERDWALRLTSSSYSAVCAAISTGMGITALARSVVPHGLQVLEDADLPPLPDVDLAMHFDASRSNPASRTFVRFVQERLPAGLSGPDAQPSRRAGRVFDESRPHPSESESN